MELFSQSSTAFARLTGPTAMLHSMTFDSLDLLNTPEAESHLENGGRVNWHQAKHKWDIFIMFPFHSFPRNYLCSRVIESIY